MLNSSVEMMILRASYLAAPSRKTLYINPVGLWGKVNFNVALWPRPPPVRMTGSPPICPGCLELKLLGSTDEQTLTQAAQPDGAGKGTLLRGYEKGQADNGAWYWSSSSPRLGFKPSAEKTSIMDEKELNDCEDKQKHLLLHGGTEQEFTQSSSVRPGGCGSVWRLSVMITAQYFYVQQLWFTPLTSSGPAFRSGKFSFVSSLLSFCSL